VLAILLLHADEVVSTDRLIDLLWGDAPPEDAATALQAHVSRLRKALPGGAAVLVTQSPGYVLRVAEAHFDLARFRAGVRDARAALDEGDPAASAAGLRAALDLWRGRPLADLEDEPFARDATAGLEDEWLDALCIRIDADLVLGRHVELVPELRALVRTHPLHEGLRAQLMLALYRSGRQAEALEAFVDARRQLNDELGLEPGPALQRLQKQILVHDPALEVARDPRAPRRSTRRWVVAAAVVVALAAAAVAAATVLASESGAPSPEAGGGALLRIDGTAGTLGTRTPVGRAPAALASGEGGIWLLDADARTVSRFEPEKGTISTFATGATPTDIAVGAGGVWVGNGRRLSASQFIGPVATSVARIDPVSKTERADIRLPRKGGALSNLVENHLAATDDAVWAVAPDFSLARIDATSSAVTAVARPFPVQAVAAGPAGVWVLGTDGAVARVDERTARVVAQARVPATTVAAIAVGADAAWVTSSSDGRLWRVEAAGKPTLGSVDIGEGAADVAVGDGFVWVANPLAGTVVQVDVGSAAVVRTHEVGGVPRSITTSGDGVWVALSHVDAPAVASGDVKGIRPLPPTSCEPVVYGGDADADALIVTDLALQGGVRVLTTQMAQAVAFVLRERGFRAGSFKIALQSCDDSIATTGLFDLAKCAANARAYSANPSVLSVIGTFNSPCAGAAIPVLNRAPGGGLAMVGPSTSFGGLTRPGPGAPPELLAATYPTGKRNFVRVSPTDETQMAALALTARRLGHERIALLDDGDRFYGGPLASAFGRAASRTGLDVVFRESWDPQASSYRGLVEAVRRSGAEAVVLSGLLDTNGGQVVRELRAQLSPATSILANDGFTPISLLLARAGEAGRGVYVSLNGLTVERLGPAGKRFVHAFAATQPGVDIQPTAVYAAQAAEVLLDAIARSDGTRASVIRQLFRTKVKDGLLGDFTFDENGDISASPVTILRAERAGGSNTVQSFEGARIVRIERPSVGLVR
jgi:DNA-binding SARP family transcriptional activator/ABC-type branched-subunit amino acid transport system substrate-binding protein